MYSVLDYQREGLIPTRGSDLWYYTEHIVDVT